MNDINKVIILKLKITYFYLIRIKLKCSIFLKITACICKMYSVKTVMFPHEVLLFRE